LVVSLIAYVANSAYYIFGSSSASVHLVSSWLLAGLYGYLCGLIVYNIRNNIKSLLMQRNSVSDPSMREIRSGFTQKIVMFLLFGICIVCYYLVHSAFLIVPPFLDITDREYEILVAYHSVFGMIIILCITTIFHPCFFTANFQLSQQVGVFFLTKIIQK